MNNSEILKNIFALKEIGLDVDISKLPSDISRDVVQKNLLQIELKQLKNNGGNIERIREIELILNPPEETGGEV